MQLFLATNMKKIVGFFHYRLTNFAYFYPQLFVHFTLFSFYQLINFVFFSLQPTLRKLFLRSMEEKYGAFFFCYRATNFGIFSDDQMAKIAYLSAIVKFYDIFFLLISKNHRYFSCAWLTYLFYLFIFWNPQPNGEFCHIFLL